MLQLMMMHKGPSSCLSCLFPCCCCTLPLPQEILLTEFRKLIEEAVGPLKPVFGA